MSGPDTRIPPNALDVERTLLGTFLVEPGALVGCHHDLPMSAFYGSQNGEIYAAMVSMVESGGVVDVVTLRECLKNRGTLEKIGGEIYLGELCESIGVKAAIGDYLKIVTEKAIYRDIITTCSKLSNQAFEGDHIEKLLGQIETLGVKVGSDCDRASIKRRRRGEVIRVRDIAEKVFKYHAEGFQNIGISLESFWPKFAEHYRPAKGTLNVLTGIPGHGKSEFLDALMVGISVAKNWKWAVFTPENYPWELYVQKLAEKVSGIGFFRSNEADLSTIIDWIDEHFFLLEPDEDNISVEALLQLNNEAIQNFGVDACVWDPWNEVSLDVQANEKETDYIGRNLSRIRRFTRRHNVLQFIVAHPAKMQRDLKTKKYFVPSLYDISGSAHWYNKTDNGFTVYRNFDTHIIDLHVQKIKFKVHGRVGLCQFTYDKLSGRFNELEETETASETKKAEAEQTNFWQDGL